MSALAEQTVCMPCNNSHPQRSIIGAWTTISIDVPPCPLRKHAESQENDGQTGPRARARQCLHKGGTLKSLTYFLSGLQASRLRNSFFLYVRLSTLLPPCPAPPQGRRCLATPWGTVAK